MESRQSGAGRSAGWALQWFGLKFARRRRCRIGRAQAVLHAGRDHALQTRERRALQTRGACCCRFGPRQAADAAGIVVGRHAGIVGEQLPGLSSRRQSAGIRYYGCGS